MKTKSTAESGAPKNIKKEKTRSRQIPISIIILLLALVVFCAAAHVLRNNSLQNGNKEGNASPFRDCKVLEENCADVSCAYYSFCGDPGYKGCKIYDCGKDYGIYSVSKDGKEEYRKDAKPDTAAIEAEKEACKGSMEIIDQKCVDGRFQIKTKIITKGECKIGNFAVIYEEGGSQPNENVAQGDGIYMISVNSCGKVAELIPVTQDGMSLEF